MIELVVDELCIKCDRCIAICPTNVFEPTASGIPEIARQEDCHTCMSCELHCPVDALYVSPRGVPDPVDKEQIVRSGILGSYQRALGWNRARPGGSEEDPGVLLRFQHKPDISDTVRARLHDLSLKNYI